MRDSRELIKKIRETHWYIEPLDAHTNEVIASLLPAEDCILQVLCQDGNKRDFWLSKYAAITELKNSKSQINLKFNIFKRDGNYGPVKKWDFPKKKLNTQEKKVAGWLKNLERKQIKNS